MFEPSRLSFARKRRGMRAAVLAEAAGVSRATLSAYESGRRVPPDVVRRSFARALAISTAFFSGEPIEPLPVGAVSLRRPSAVTVARRDAALAAGRLGVEFMSWIDRKFHLPIPDLPIVSDLDPQVAADVVRTRWGLGVTPISNMVHLLESRGVRVLRLPADCVDAGTFSVWVDAAPYVFLADRSTAGARFDAAHELAHLVLHGDRGEFGHAQEEEADAFAAAFLMPQDGVLAHGTANPSTADIARMGRIWRVAAPVMASRLRELGLIGDRRYRDIRIDLASVAGVPGGRDPVDSEDSLLLRKVLDLLRSERLPLFVVAADLGVTTDELNSYISGLTPVVIRGGGQTSPRDRSHLRVVS